MSAEVVGVYDRYMLRGVAWLCRLSGSSRLVWAAAHALAHDVVAQPSGRHGAGHGRGLDSYLAYLPTSVALCLTLAAAIATGAALGKRWAGRSGRSLWLFGFVPVLVRSRHSRRAVGPRGNRDRSVRLVPVFLIGLLVQILFALVAVGLAGGSSGSWEQLTWPAPQELASAGRPELPASPGRTRRTPPRPLPGAGQRSRGPPHGLHS